ncbi:MAG: hypothetical protein CSA33_08885 [Desulfobulbus propionicus]|nr:MAG: hypothetical protein CSA33_08885 [Desulfobulbus propionicus]
MMKKDIFPYAFYRLLFRTISVLEPLFIAAHCDDLTLFPDMPPEGFLASEQPHILTQGASMASPWIHLGCFF